MKIVVFLGPSLPVQAARARLDAIYLPPCAMGDVYAALQRHKPQAIGIVDGLFERTPSVWHKEILYALSQGVAVFGGASMGALRAAELAAFGMRGVGRIFEDLHSGRLEDDDEVAVTHLAADEGYRTLSEPMVNLRHGLELARRENLLDAGEVLQLVAAMKALYYPQRCWPALLAAATACGIPDRRIEAVREFVAARRPDLKRDDAVAVLEALRSWREAGAPVEPPPAAFESTLFWEHLVAHRGAVACGAPAGATVTRERLTRHLRLGAPDRDALLNDALLLELAEQAARQLALPAVDDRAALTRFRRQRGLTGAAALAAWMGRQGLDTAGCLELARSEATLRALHWRLQEQVDLQLPRVLQRQGRLDAALATVQAQWRRLDELGIDHPGEAEVESIDTVMDWYQQRFGAVHGELEAHVVERGFGSPRQFVSELVAQYLVAQTRVARPAEREEAHDASR